MATKPLRFSIHQLIIPEETPFTVDTFSLIDDSKLETTNINHSEEEQVSTVKGVSSGIISW